MLGEIAPRDPTRKTPGTREKIHLSARNLYRAKLDESLLKARSLIKLSVNTMRYRGEDEELRSIYIYIYTQRRR